jgi:Ca-activated chloride channel family protein
VIPLDDIGAAAPDAEPGTGRLGDGQGGLPLVAMDVVADVCGLVSTTRVRQVFRNDRGAAIEATYVFPLPGRAAVTSFTATLGGRLVEGILQERAQARQTYDEAIALGHRAAIAEEDRAGVLPPGSATSYPTKRRSWSWS